MVHEIFLPFEAQQIIQIPLSDRAHDDSLVWAATPSGIFSVQSAYKCIREWQTQDNGSTSDNHSDDVWQRIWSLNVPPRFAHFLWKIVKRIVPTRQRLWNRGVRCPIFCPRCGVYGTCVKGLLLGAQGLVCVASGFQVAR